MQISRIEARSAGGGFVDTGLAYSGNLLDLKNTDLLLGQVTLPAGQYSGLRLTVAGGTITIGEQTHHLEPVTGLGGNGLGNYPLTDNQPGIDGLAIPSVVPGPATGHMAEAMAQHMPAVTVGSNRRSATLLINAPFTVTAEGTITALLLDFNVAHSVIATGDGRYLLRPIIPVVRRDEAGEVTGKVVLDPAPALGEEPVVEVAALPAAQTSKAQNATVADGVRQGGAFRIPALPGGSYDVTVTAQGYAPVTLPGVLIVPGQKPDLGQITLSKP